jgi:hypothetical protein
MDWNDLWYALRTYPAVVTGVLALAGIAIGLIWNSHIARRERKAKILHDKQTLRVALLEQFRKLKESMEYRDRALAEADTFVFALSSDPMTLVFRASIDKLGLLPEEVLRKVLAAGLGAEHLPKNLRLVQHPEHLADLSEHFIVIPKEHYEDARYTHRERAKDLGDAIIALENWQPNG